MVDTAGVILGAVALYSLAIDSMKFLANCVHFPDDAHQLHVKFLLQKDIVMAWGRASGLEQGVVPPYLNEDAIRIVFTEIHFITASTETIVNRYRLKLSDLPTPHPYPINQIVNLTTSGDATNVSEHETRIREIRRHTNWLRRFRWASWDKAKFESLVNDLKDFVDALHKFLAGAQYEAFSLERKLTRFRRISSSDLAQLRALEGASSDDQTLLASTRLKIARVEAFQQRSAQPSTVSTYARLPKGDLAGSSVSQQPSIRITSARFRHQNVVVEWKPYGRSRNTQMVDRSDRLVRVHALVNLLMQDKPEELRTLRCLGFIDDIESSHFCLVFEWPRAIPTTVEPQSLLNLIEKWPYTSLSDRLRLAYRLAGCIFELLVVGWYHKCIRPQNVLFFPINDHSEFPDPHLIGFDYSRPAGTTTQVSEGELENPEFDIYRPSPQLISNQPFRVDFDIYSFGLVLLVIAKWKKIEDIVKEFRVSANTPQQIWQHILSPGSKNRLRLIQDLRFRVGNIYAEVVDWCLVESHNSTGTSYDFSDLVYKKLQNIQQVV